MNWARIEQTFDEAMEKAPEARADYVRTKLADAPDLQAEVLAMLAAGVAVFIIRKRRED